MHAMQLPYTSEISGALSRLRPHSTLISLLTMAPCVERPFGPIAHSRSHAHLAMEAIVISIAPSRCEC
eukprot:3037277-Prymnesium_polylepis.1